MGSLGIDPDALKEALSTPAFIVNAHTRLNSFFPMSESVSTGLELPELNPKQAQDFLRQFTDSQDLSAKRLRY